MNFTLRFGSGSRAQFGTFDFEGILATSLQRFTRRLKQVCLYIADANGPRGGVDKHCRCVLHVRRMPPVVIRDQDEDLYALIVRVANRATFVLSEKAKRRTHRGKRLHGRRSHSESFAGPSCLDQRSSPDDEC